MTEYIKWLRTFVGHEPILQTAASVIVENEKGEILMQQRADDGTWGYAGGSVELGESVEQAAVRELYEETGLIADEIELFSVFSGKEYYHIYPNGDAVYNIDIVFICKKYHGEMKADEKEVKRLEFFAKDNLPTNLSKPTVTPLMQYISSK